MASMHFMVPAKVKQRLDALAEERYLTPSAVARQLLIGALKELDSQVPVEGDVRTVRIAS